MPIERTYEKDEIFTVRTEVQDIVLSKVATGLVLKDGIVLPLEQSTAIENVSPLVGQKVVLKQNGDGTIVSWGLAKFWDGD